MSSTQLVEAERTHGDLVVARLGEFFDHRTPWNRGLWQVSPILALQEVVEYGKTVLAGQPPDGLVYVCESAQMMCRTDPGIGSQTLRGTVSDLLGHLATGARLPPHELDGRLTAVMDLARRCLPGYLLRWAETLRGASHDRPGVELTARRLASHLLDQGFSGDHLHGWVTKAGAAAKETALVLAELLEEADDMCARPAAEYDVLVTVADTPKGAPTSDAGPFRYLDQHATLTWLAEWADARVARRPAGALRVRVEARDPWSAVERANELVARAAARVAVGIARTSALRLTGEAWVAGKHEPLPLVQPRRQVRVPSLERHEVVYSVASDEKADPLDDALELLASMEQGTTGAAVTNGWAAIEGLLKRPKEKAVVAADRLADITACSFPLAEMLHLAQVHAKTSDDDLAAQLREARSARARLSLLEGALRAERPISARSPRDAAALARVEGIVADPTATFTRVRRYMAEAFRRLYNQRNLVMHSGSLHSVALRATLRTTPALVGAGMDRIVHARFARGRGTSARPDAIELASRALTEIDLLGTADARPLSELLN